jgi:hypothetical protein
MTIETKYNIGDKAWFDSHGVLEEASVTGIRVSVLLDGYVIITYSLVSLVKNGTVYFRSEDQLFSTKEELQKSL